MTIGVIIFFFLAIIGASAMMLLTTARTNSFKNKTYGKLAPSEQAIILHNSFVTKSNKLNERFYNVSDKVLSNIRLANDRAAFERLKYFAEEFYGIRNEISDYFLRSSDCLEQKDYAGSKYCCECIENLLSEGKNLLKDIERIEITDSNTFTDFVEEQDIKDVSVFFNGITTREALSARYKKLAKVFHPDSESGDKATFEALKEEYDRLMKEFV